MKEYYGGVVPSEDNRDFLASNIIGSQLTTLPKSVRMITVANNQGLSSETKVACTCYASYNVANILNEIEHHKGIAQRPDIGWRKQKEFGTHSANGDLIHTALKSIVQNGHITDTPKPNTSYKIDGFARVNDSELKQYLAQGFPIITYGPVSKTNFNNAKLSGLYKPYDSNPTITHHAFAIVGYYDDVFLCMNSYGPDWGVYKDGTFEIKVSDIGNIGQKYLLYDHKDIKMIFRDVSENSPYAEAIKYCLDNGIFKGDDSDNIADPVDRFFRPSDPISRQELALVLYRLLTKK